jgi:hypothetical protein
MRKVCTGCKIEKEFTEFNKATKGLFGLDQKCRGCIKARSKKTVHSEKAIEKRKAYRSEWQKKKRPILNARLRDRYENNLELSRKQAIERNKRYMQTEKGKARHHETTRQYEQNNKEKISAQRKVRAAVNSGRLVRSLRCEICNKETKTHGHHEDYKKPLEVIWMCSKCHLYHHQQYRFHAERLNEGTPKGDAKVRPTNESSGG